MGVEVISLSTVVEVFSEHCCSPVSSDEQPVVAVQEAQI